MQQINYQKYKISLRHKIEKIVNNQYHKFTFAYTVMIPIVRKSRKSGQKVRGPISFSGLIGVSVIRKTR